MTEYFSRFGGLWIDTPGADGEIDEALRRGAMTSLEAERIRSFIANGYIIIPQAVSNEVVDAVLQDIAAIPDHSERYVAKLSGGTNYDHPNFANYPRTARINELYVNSDAAARLMFAPPIARFLQLIFGKGAIAIAMIYFRWGSQQSIHQDTAYVVMKEPMQLAACWVALEDVTQGAGELIYYEGSHRNTEYLFSGTYKHFDPGRDGQDDHKKFLAHLHSTSKERGLPLRRFLPKKGDALIWHADLAHGGARVVDENKTRQSLVTHYCPADVVPNYFSVSPFHTKIEAAPGCYYTARHYDLSQPSPRLPIYMGRTRKRPAWSSETEVFGASLTSEPVMLNLDGVSISDCISVAIEIKAETGGSTLELRSGRHETASPQSRVIRTLSPGVNKLAARMHWADIADRTLTVSLQGGRGTAEITKLVVDDEI